MQAPLPRHPRIAFTKTPVWNLADEEARHAFSSFAERLDANVATVELPKIFEEAVSSHKIIMQADFALNFADIYRRGADKLSPVLKETIEAGMAVPAYEYNRAVERIPRLNAALETLMQEYDALTDHLCGPGIRTPLASTLRVAPFSAPSGPSAAFRPSPCPC